MTDQPDPIPNQHPALWPKVIEECRARHEKGLATYGTPLQPGNGRHALQDARAELLDGAVYLMQAEEEWRLLGKDLRQLGRDLSMAYPWIAKRIDVILARYPMLGKK